MCGRRKARGRKNAMLLFFNLSEADEDVRLAWTEIGVSGSVSAVRDLWKHESVGEIGGVNVRLRPHASVMYRVSVGSAN